jgi:hypothetical protein
MAGFIETEILSKEIDKDTYFLVPLEKIKHEQQNILVISESFDDNLRSIVSSMPELNRDENLEQYSQDVLNIINNLNFYEKIAEMLSGCFPNMDIQSIFIPGFINHMLISKNNILQLVKYVIMSYGKEPNIEINNIIKPYGFLTIQENPNDVIKIKKTKQGDWESTKYYMIYNVCKNNTLDKKEICTNMLNIVVDSETYGQFPLFLFVNKENEAAQKCYRKNKFQVVKDIFSGLPNRPTEIRQYDKDNIYMCHNKYDLKLIEGTNEYELMSNDAYRFTLVAHGAIQSPQRNIFEPGFNPESIFQKYYFPFKNMQYYVQKGDGLFMPSEIPEQTGIYDVCYETILPNEEETEVPENGIIKTLPMSFAGLQSTDPRERAEFIGLFDCNIKERIAINPELFGEANEKSMFLDEVLLKMYAHCVKNDIEPSNVEVKIFACRGFCPSGDFPVLRNQPRKQISDNQEIEEDVNEQLGGENTDEVKTTVHYEPIGKSGLFEYLKQHTEICELPKKGGKIKLTKKRRYKRKKKTLKKVF